MTKLWTAALILVITSVAQAASVEIHPIPLKERLKWEMWVEGIPEFTAKESHLETRIDENLERTLRKLNL